MSALSIRSDFGSEELRRRAWRERDGRISARLIAIANALEGMDRASAARLAGMDRQTLRDRVHRYNSDGVAGLCNRPAPGTQAEADRRPDGNIESGRIGRYRSGSGQNRAVADRRSVPMGGGALGRQLQRDRDAETVVVARPVAPED